MPPPLVFLTGYADHTHAELRKLGAADVYEKPVHADMVLEIVRKNLPARDRSRAVAQGPLHRVARRVAQRVAPATVAARVAAAAASSRAVITASCARARGQSEASIAS